MKPVTNPMDERVRRLANQIWWYGEAPFHCGMASLILLMASLIVWSNAWAAIFSRFGTVPQEVMRWALVVCLAISAVIFFGVQFLSRKLYFDPRRRAAEEELRAQLKSDSRLAPVLQKYNSELAEGLMRRPASSAADNGGKL